MYPTQCLLPNPNTISSFYPNPKPTPYPYPDPDPDPDYYDMAFGVWTCPGGKWPEGRGFVSETLYHRDDALVYIAYVMLIWAAPIPADRWHCSLWP